MQLARCLIYGLEIPQMIRIRNERLEIILWRMLPLQTTTDTPDKTLTVNNHSNTLHTNIRTANTPHPHHTPVAAA